MTDIKQPGRRDSRQAKSARDALDKEFEVQFIVMVDKSLKKQFALCCQSQNTTMKKVINDFMKTWSKKHYQAAMNDYENLPEKVERRDL